MSVGLLVIGPMAWLLQGAAGVVQAAAAAAICCLAGLSALVLTGRLFRSQQALLGMLLSMALRSIPPLGICMLLAISGQGQQYLGFVGYLLVFYMAGLAAETYASVRIIQESSSGPAARVHAART